ncbi:cytochrome P450 family protein [Sinosporangium siamense]|uniref:Cytochrome P450 hydroxylase n=1 Tax=Sinosporangium siamense TaxID=1367973 RepID=A0A919V657_9ACTN|nr:cytochrome P450 [Sinosporangium siamense]GII90602.1 cytochrome P450 hydroxylase [Sinosporangium siamense]
MKIKEQLLGPGVEHDPYPAYGRRRDEAPVCPVYLRDGVRCWVILRYAEARAALADPRFSRDPRFAGPSWRQSDRDRDLEDGSGLGIHLLTREPPDHTRLRRMVAGAFTARRTEAMRGRVQKITHDLIDAFAARGSAELVGELAYPLPAIVMCETFGIPLADQGHFRQWTSNAVLADDGQPVYAPPPDEYLRDLVAGKRAAPTDDLLSELVAAEQAGQLSETELLSMLFLLIIAGHENTVGLIANGVLALTANPEQLALLRERPDMIEGVVEEVLRYDGPMELAAWRFAAEPVTIGETTIPAGEPVVIALAAAHRDPDRFADPDRFDITRPDAGAHLGFGYGLHHCLGAALGRMEAAVALSAVVQRLPDLAPAVPIDQLERGPGSIVRSLYELPVTFTVADSPGGAG